jgi:hypothetical protein
MTIIQKNSFQNIPKEITREIFSHLSPAELCKIGEVCKSFQEISSEDRFWKKLEGGIHAEIPKPLSDAKSKAKLHWYHTRISMTSSSDFKVNSETNLQKLIGDIFCKYVISELDENKILEFVIKLQEHEEAYFALKIFKDGIGFFKSKVLRKITKTVVFDPDLPTYSKMEKTTSFLKENVKINDCDYCLETQSKHIAQYVLGGFIFATFSKLTPNVTFFLR